MARERLRVGTRGSRLALWQADRVAELLSAAFPELEVERVVIRTKGDRVLDTALSKIGDKGLFTRELESALHERRIDAAVHSLKDLPTAIPDGLALEAVLEREDPRDALICPSRRGLDQLPSRARVGTSSLRRRAQLLARRPDLEIVDLRGNVPTRVEKVERGDCDAAVLARAGLLRLGLESKITELLEPDVMLSAVGQGAIAVQARAGDEPVAARLSALEHGATRLCVTAERALLARLEGGCQVPIGALAALAGGRLTLRALVADVDGAELVRGQDSAAVRDGSDAVALGTRLAERLLSEGAAQILVRTRDALVAPGPEAP